MEHSPIALSRLVGLLHLQPETSASAHGTVILAVTCGIALLLSPAFVCRGVEVMKVQQYGCFVALESCTQGLVLVSQLYISRVADPAPLFQAGLKMNS